MRNWIIFGGIFIALSAAGAWINNQREIASACAEQRYIDFVRPEIVEGYEDKSIYFTALKAALEAENLDPSQRPAYENELELIQTALSEGVVRAQEISPSSSVAKTCRYTLETQTNHRVIVRFVLELEELPGTEFQRKYDKRQRNIILLEELQPGVPVEAVSIAEFGRRTIVIEEPEFRGARYDLRFTPDVVIPVGVISEIPK